MLDINRRKLDNRQFSQEAYTSLLSLRINLKALAKESLIASRRDHNPAYNPSEEEVQEKFLSYCKKSSALAQGLSTYISMWGLHRLSADARKFSLGTASDTKYKGQVYSLFLERLRSLSGEKFVLWDNNNPNTSESSLVNMPLRKYTALNHLAIKLANEWSFWATATLEE